jgi:hypothetical protein
MFKNLFRSVCAVLIGFISVVALSISIDFIFEVLGIFPGATHPELYVPWMLVVALIYRSFAAVLGGYITAKFSSARSMCRVYALMILGFIGGVAGVVNGWSYGNRWYPVLLAVTGPVFVWLGGKLQTFTWIKTSSVVTTEATKEQVWKLFTDVNNWHIWNNEVEFAKLEGRFEAGNHYVIKPKKTGKAVTVKLLEVKENSSCVECGEFPLAKMFYDHRLEETEAGLKITNTITVRGLLSLLWVHLVVKKIAAEMSVHVRQQIKEAAKM